MTIAHNYISESLHFGNYTNIQLPYLNRVHVLGDDVRDGISDRDVGEHAVRGAVLSTHCSCLMSWLFCLSPAGETHRSDRVQLFCHILCHGSTFHQSQFANACRSDGRNKLQNSEAPICLRHRDFVDWIQSSWRYRKLFSCCYWKKY